MLPDRPKLTFQQRKYAHCAAHENGEPLRAVRPSTSRITYRTPSPSFMNVLSGLLSSVNCDLRPWRRVFGSVRFANLIFPFNDLCNVITAVKCANRLLSILHFVLLLCGRRACRGTLQCDGAGLQHFLLFLRGKRARRVTLQCDGARGETLATTFPAVWPWKVGPEPIAQN